MHGCAKYRQEHMHARCCCNMQNHTQITTASGVESAPAELANSPCTHHLHILSKAACRVFHHHIMMISNDTCLILGVQSVQRSISAWIWSKLLPFVSGTLDDT
jgi:hypothetical protein